MQIHPLTTSTRTLSEACPHCAAARPEATHVLTSAQTIEPSSQPRLKLITIPAGSFQMGNPRNDGYPGDGEGPVHEINVDAFEMSPTTVSNNEFASFIESTGYITEAEQFGWSFVFAGFLPSSFPATRGVQNAQWWRQVHGAAWNHPEGPDSSIEKRGNHPAIHLSWNDAQAYCTWSGTRLPTEAEWEYAARGGTSGSPFWWGNDLTPGGKHRMNVWQGKFPQRNSAADGYSGTAPVDAFAANPYGLYNMTGNVWEWCADWFDAAAYAATTSGQHQPPAAGTHRVMRGGSYLCHRSYCNRYRVDSRSANTPDSSTGNIGFRVVRSLPSPDSQ